MRYSFESRCRAVAAMVAGLSPGVAAQAVMTDNGPAYRSHAWRQHCAAHDLRHLRTRPYTPRTNGKAERFIQLLLHRWASAFAYPSSAHRTRALIGWLPVV